MLPKRLRFHIFVRLAGNAFYHEADIQRLRATLPSCTLPVIADHEVVVLATVTEDTENELLQRCRDALGTYHVITVVELGRLSASTDGLYDPFHDWMHTHARQSTRPDGEGYNPEDVLKAKWGKVRREGSKPDSIIDAIRKVFPGTAWPRRKGV